MQRRIRQAFTSLREHTCVSYAKIATIGGFCDVDLTIVKATSPDDFPLHDRYVHQFLKIFAVSPVSCRAFALNLARRFSKTQSWRVAIKCLVLLHRLLRLSPDDSVFRAEVSWTRTHRLLSLYPCNFRDLSSSASECYTAFVRSYARLLDEALDCVCTEINSLEHTGLNEHSHGALDQGLVDEDMLTNKIRDIGKQIELLPQLQGLIDRVLDCRPAGPATRNFIIQSTMKHVIRESFTCYSTIRREMGMILDNLIQLPYRTSLAAFGIYKKASFQAAQLSDFHDSCKSMGYCGSYEYPTIDLIPKIQIQALENFLNRMWQFTDQSSSSNVSSSFTSNEQYSPVSRFSDDASEVRAPEKPDKMFEQEEKDMEMKPLIQWEAENTSARWEDLLDASINTTAFMESNNIDWAQATFNGWQMEVYNPYVLQTPNPNYQPHRTMFYHGSCPTTPVHAWANF